MGACSVYNVWLHASVDSSVAIASWPGRLSVCGGGCIKPPWERSVSAVVCRSLEGCGAVRAVLVCRHGFTTVTTALIENFADFSLATVKQPKHILRR